MTHTTAKQATTGAANGAAEARIVSLRPARRSFAELLRRRATAKVAQPARDADARWILSAPSRGHDAYTEFLVLGAAASALRPAVLRSLARLGPFPFSLRLRAPQDAGTALELRIGGLDQAAADRIAKAVARAPAVHRVRYRNGAFGGEIHAPRRAAVRQDTAPLLAASA